MKWRLWVVLYLELDSLRFSVTVQQSCQREAEVDASGDTATGNAIAVNDDALGNRNRAQQRQLITRHPVTSRPVSFQQSCCAKHQ